MKETIVSVDIQPIYEKWIKFSMYEYCDYINKKSKTHDVILYFNNFDKRDEEQFIDWLLEYELEEEALNRVTIIGKTYGFIKSGCDTHGEGLVEELLEYMVENKIYDSRNIKESDLFQITGEEFDSENEPIFIPDDILEVINNIKGKILFLGGGREECLREIEIIARILGKKYRFHPEFTY